MKRPSFQFYPGDWRNNAKLRRCSDAARGAWMDVLCVLHDSDEYGVARWPLADLARAAGVPLRLVKELATKEVLKGSDTLTESMWWAPMHAGKRGEEVALVVSDGGPCWYSSRMVTDEHIRQRRGSGTRFTEDNQPPTRTPKGGFGGDIGGRQGDGASSSSSSSSLPNDSSRSLVDHEGERARPEPTLAGRTCLLLREAGFGATNPSHPSLLAALAAGVTPEVIRDTAVEGKAIGKGHPLQWAYATALSRHTEPAPQARAGPNGAMTIPTSRTLAAITTLQSAKLPETTP